MREIGLAGDRAQRGEFGRGEAHEIQRAGARVRHIVERRLFRAKRAARSAGRDGAFHRAATSSEWPRAAYPRRDGSSIRWSRPNGSRRISASLTWWWSTPVGTCRRAAATGGATISPRIFPARASSTSTRSATGRIPRRTCCRRRRLRPRDGAARRRPRRPDRRLRQLAAPDRGARLVHAPAFRRSASRDPRRRIPEMARRRRPIESGEPAARNAQFEAAEARRVVTKEQFLAGRRPPCSTRAARAASKARARSRPGIAAGHIPGARNLPFALALQRRRHLQTTDELQRLFAEAGVDPLSPFVASCGSGVTATA